MLANTHKAICLDKRDLKKPKNDKMRADIKFSILQMTNLGYRKRNQVSRIPCTIPVIVSSQQSLTVRFWLLAAD